MDNVDKIKEVVQTFIDNNADLVAEIGQDAVVNMLIAETYRSVNIPPVPSYADSDAIKRREKILEVRSEALKRAAKVHLQESKRVEAFYRNARQAGLELVQHGIGAVVGALTGVLK